MKKMNQNSAPVKIIGAGLTGPLLAIYLAKRGYRSQLYERRPDIRQETISAGRSINLALASRGIKPLREVGLFEKIEHILIPMFGRVLHDLQGNTTFQAYGKDESEFNYSVSRAALSICLMNALEESGMGTIEFNQRCLSVDIESQTLNFRHERSNKTQASSFETVIGADGSASALRQQLAKLPEFSSSEDYLSHGYKELTIPATAQGSYAIEKNALHIWPRGGNMLIALPNTDGTFTATLFLPMQGAESFATLTSPEALMKFFTANFPDATELMPTLINDFFRQPNWFLGDGEVFPLAHGRTFIVTRRCGACGSTFPRSRDELWL
jgi:kynurenine 3-monooxygenase